MPVVITVSGGTDSQFHGYESIPCFILTVSAAAEIF
jgi:hypothetical protein